MVDDYLDYLASEGKSPRTLQTYKARLNEFLEWCDANPNNLQTPDLRRYLKYLRTRPKRPGFRHKTKPTGTLLPPALRGHVAALKGFFRFLVEEEYLPDNPAERLTFPKVPSTLPRAVTEEQVRMWLRPIHKFNTSLVNNALRHPLDLIAQHRRPNGGSQRAPSPLPS